MNLLGIFHSHSDPSAALMMDDKVVAFVEEERLSRQKHSFGAFPTRAIRWVLKRGGLALTDVDAIVQAWDCAKYDGGHIAGHYDKINLSYPTTEGDRAYQQNLLQLYRSETQRSLIRRALWREFGDVELPEIRFVNHHLAHACATFFSSGFDEALVMSVDGSGEEITTSWWHGRDGALELLHEVKIPHSLGWVYSAFTEYLGFEAYDGEYKVMGLAAYGSPNSEVQGKIAQLLWPDDHGGFETNAMLLTRGSHSWSHYFSDALVQHMGRQPAWRDQPVTDWHKDVAFAVQQRLEDVVFSMTRYWTRRTGVRRLCISGGVGLNVKMNGNLFESGIVDDVFAYPLCADLGQSIGAALAYRYQHAGLTRQRLSDLYLGPGFSDEEIERVLRDCRVEYRKSENISGDTAGLLMEGKVVGWFQGRIEAGPRALGARSILADPRNEAARDRVNAAIKYRELWRPFCPSMTREGAERYFDRFTEAPFMVITFRANSRAKAEIPAVVHVDGTSRPQIVDEETNPRYHNVIAEFGRLTGVPCVLNTSFNIKGEPIVCTPQDALRTYFATGLDALAIGNCLLEKFR
ncbi:MAG TPA: carbamoyltransferase C-terminal domain-containing protein [Acetobacteraceae bacterium]|jgi:carbamoyltransferase